MKTITGLMILAVLLAATVACFAGDDLNIGTWKLNEAKSRFLPGSQKHFTVMNVTAGDSVKVTVDGVDADGAPTHNEWTGKFDGKDYPVIGDPMIDTRAYKRVNDHTLAITAKKDGKVTTTGLIVVSADGKTRTVNVKGSNAKGRTISSYAVYDKQLLAVEPRN